MRKKSGGYHGHVPGKLQPMSTRDTISADERLRGVPDTALRPWKGTCMKEIQRLLTLFADAHGVSGHEGAVASLLAAELEPLVDEVTTDGMGNVVGTRNGTGPSIMIAAHMDEIGFMVKYIDENGFLRFVPLGGWSDQMALGQRVFVHGAKGEVMGVIAITPITSPLAPCTNTRCPNAIWSDHPPRGTNRRKPFSSMYLTMKPISSMWAAIMMEGPVPFLVPTTLPMPSVVTSSTSGSSSAARSEATAPSWPDTPCASAKRVSRRWISFMQVPFHGRSAVSGTPRSRSSAEIVPRVLMGCSFPGTCPWYPPDFLRILQMYFRFACCAGAGTSEGVIDGWAARRSAWPHHGRSQRAEHRMGHRSSGEA